MNTFIKTLTKMSLAFCFLGTAALSGCSKGSGVDAKIALYDRSSQALSIGTVNALGGTYGAACDERSGDWNVGLPGYMGTVTNPLSVVLDDTNCVLTVTSLLVNSTTYEADPAIDLGLSYQQDASAFKNPLDTGHETDVVFYGNSKISSMDFGANFTISMLYSDKPDSASGSAGSTFQAETASISADNVDPPDFTTFNTSSLGIEVNVSKIVTSVAAMGKVAMSGATVLGDHYAVVTDLDLSGTPTYNTVDAAFLARTQTSFSAQPVDVPVSALSLIGEDLTTSIKRFIIISHLQNGARSYQVVTLTISGPA